MRFKYVSVQVRLSCVLGLFEMCFKCVSVRLRYVSAAFQERLRCVSSALQVRWRCVVGAFQVRLSCVCQCNTYSPVAV